jgi:hypothetical protein
VGARGGCEREATEEDEWSEASEWGRRIEERASGWGVSHVTE